MIYALWCGAIPWEGRFKIYRMRLTRLKCVSPWFMFKTQLCIAYVLPLFSNICILISNVLFNHQRRQTWRKLRELIKKKYRQKTQKQTKNPLCIRFITEMSYVIIYETRVRKVPWFNCTYLLCEPSRNITK